MTRRSTAALTLLVQLISCGNAQETIKIIYDIRLSKNITIEDNEKNLSRSIRR